VTTREQYAVRRLGSVTVGIQADADAAEVAIDMRRLSMWLDDALRGEPSRLPVEVETWVKAFWPGRAYWIEVGDDESWVQVVEYGAFAGKVHKAGGA